MKQKKDNTNKKKQIHDFKTNQKAERSPTHVNKNRKANSEVKKTNKQKSKTGKASSGKTKNVRENEIRNTRYHHAIKVKKD